MHRIDAAPGCSVIASDATNISRLARMEDPLVLLPTGREGWESPALRALRIEMEPTDGKVDGGDPV